MKPPNSPSGSETAESGGPRFVANRIIFGKDDTRWSVPDVGSQPYCDAGWKARYAKERLTQTECFYLAECVELLHYLFILCPTTAIAISKVRDVRRAIRDEESKRP